MRANWFGFQVGRIPRDILLFGRGGSPVKEGEVCNRNGIRSGILVGSQSMRVDSFSVGA